MKPSSILLSLRHPKVTIKYIFNRQEGVKQFRTLASEKNIIKHGKMHYDSYKKIIEYNQKNSNHALYFDLCKRILTGTISDEHVKNAFFNNFDSLKESEIKEALKEKTSIGIETGVIQSPQNAYTMIGLRRLENLQYCVESILKNNMDGDLAECGVWRGGACIFMKLILNKYNSSKKIFVADSFEGLPKPDIKFPTDHDSKLHEIESLKVGLEQVKNNFKKFDTLDDNIIFIKGFFENTLKDTSIDSLSLLRLDGDMYGSTWSILENLYPKLTPSGFCIVDEYFYEPCRKAIDDYRKQNNIKAVKIPIDSSAIYWNA